MFVSNFNVFDHNLFSVAGCMHFASIIGIFVVVALQIIIMPMLPLILLIE